MINRLSLQPFKPREVAAQFDSLLRVCHDILGGVDAFQEPPQAILYFDLALKKTISALSEEDSTQQFEGPLNKQCPRFTITQHYFANPKPCNKAAESAIKNIELNPLISNQLHIDRQFVARKCAYPLTMELFRKCLNDGMMPYINQDHSTKKTWRKVKAKQQNMLLPYTPVPGKEVVKMGMLLTLSGYSPITGTKSIQFQVLSGMPISSINQLTNFCIMPGLVKTLEYEPQATFNELLWVKGGKMFVNQRDKKRRMMQDSKDQGSIDSPWDNVRVQLAAPMIYRHLGGCDHMLVVNDCVLPTERELRYEFPRQTFRGKMNIRECEGCESKLAKFALVGDETNFLCEECCQALGVEQGQKLYPYIQH